MSTEIDNKKSSQDGEIANTVVQECITLFGAVGGLMLAIEGNVMQIMAGLSIAAVSGGMLLKKSINLDTIRHPISTVNKEILKLGGYAQKYNPNQTTAIGTVITVAGVGAYVAGIISGNSDIAWAGIGAFTVGRYADLLDGDHAKMLREEGKWNTKSGGIFDADMDKVGVYTALGALAFTNSLPDLHKAIIGVEILAMVILDSVSYRLRSSERSWPKIAASMTDGGWDEKIQNNTIEVSKNKKVDANAFGKIKTLLQTLGITALGVGVLIDNTEYAQAFQKSGHLLFSGAIGFAGLSLWNKMRKK